MKNSLSKSLLFVCLLSGAAFFQQCSKAGANNDTASQATAVKEPLPQLLKRSVAIENFEEWDQISSMAANLTKKINTNPDDHDARLRLAELFMLEARVTGEHGYYYPAALKLLQSVSDRNPANKDHQFQAAALKASVFLSLHQFEKALEQGKQALQIFDHNAQVYGVLVDAYVELGNYAEAVKASDKMVSIRPDLRSYSRISYLREIHGQVPGALEAMKLAISAGYPGLEETAWARLTLGNIYSSYGDLENAEYQYRMALEERPKYAFAIDALGQLAEKQQHFEEAEKLYKEACRILPEVSFYENLAQLYQATGREKEAKVMTQEILTMLADDAAHGHVMNLQYANVYSSLLDDYDKALAFALKEYQVRPENIDVNRALAAIYFQKGNYPAAQEHLAKATSTNSADPDSKRWQVYWISATEAVKRAGRKSGKHLR